MVLAQIADFEQKLSAERSQAERNAAAIKLSREPDEIERALAPFLGASHRLASALAPIHYHFEMAQLAAFISDNSAKVEVAAAFGMQELRAMVTAIADGRVGVHRPCPLRHLPFRASPCRRRSPSAVSSLS